MTRHEFLAALHDLLQPRTYLEIGVQHGASLALAGPRCRAVAVDPEPDIRLPITADTVLVTTTSDAFFARTDPLAHFQGEPLDLVFVDGMHLIENVVRDFIGIEELSHHGTVVVFDDVLPRDRREASRVPDPGDWAGDVWKMVPILRAFRPDLKLTLVDTRPTGALVVTGLNPDSRILAERYDEIEAEYVGDLRWLVAPDEVLRRDGAVTAEQALAGLRMAADA